MGVKAVCTVVDTNDEKSGLNFWAPGEDSVPPNVTLWSSSSQTSSSAPPAKLAGLFQCSSRTCSGGKTSKKIKTIKMCLSHSVTVPCRNGQSVWVLVECQGSGCGVVWIWWNPSNSPRVVCLSKMDGRVSFWWQIQSRLSFPNLFCSWRFIYYSVSNFPLQMAKGKVKYILDLTLAEAASKIFQFPCWVGYPSWILIGKYNLWIPCENYEFLLSTLSFTIRTKYDILHMIFCSF